MAAGTAESSHLEPQVGGREHTGNDFKACPPRDTPPPTKPHLLLLLKQFHRLWPSIQTYEARGQHRHLAANSPAPHLLLRIV